MAHALVVLGNGLGILMVDSLAGVFLAVVAAAVLDVCVAVAVVVVDSVAVVYSLADLGLVVGGLLVVHLVLVVVVDSVDFLAPVVADCTEARRPVAAAAATANISKETD